MINNILNKIGLNLSKYDKTRASTKYAKEIFGDEEINVIEIGVMNGENALNILRNLNVKTMYLIDPYISTKEYPNLEENKKIAKGNLKDYENKIVWINKTSNEVLKDLPKEIDFIYIDGSHYYKQVLKDITNYYPLVKEKGILAGHDIIFHKGVSDAIIKFCYENKISPMFLKEDWIIHKNSNIKIKEDYTC